jgi:omega-amidase
MELHQLNLALVQHNPLWEDAQSNLKMLSGLLSTLDEPTNVIVLPEAFATGFSMNAKAVSQKLGDNITQWMKGISYEKNAAVCGSVFIEEDGFFYNRFLWANPEGEILQYDKRHLFSMGGEHIPYTKGEKQLLIGYKGWRIFPQICYDLRFPVWSRNTHGYDLLINVANWPAARTKVWKTLLKARAIENQSYAIGVNRVGTDGNLIGYIGETMAISFKGETLFNAKNNEGVFHIQLNKYELDTFRKKFDTLKDSDRFEIF